MDGNHVLGSKALRQLDQTLLEPFSPEGRTTVGQAEDVRVYSLGSLVTIPDVQEAQIVPYQEGKGRAAWKLVSAAP
jgi:hypothetical protein